MHASDLSAVRAVDAAAFAYLRPGRAAHMRSEADALWLFHQSPHMHLVATRDTDIIGYLFSHRLGPISWCGPIGVLPQQQASGTGAALLGAWLNSGSEPKLLETRAEVDANVAFYLKMGMRPHGLRVALRSPVAPADISVARIRTAGAGGFLAADDAWSLVDGHGRVSLARADEIWSWHPEIEKLDQQLHALHEGPRQEGLLVPVDTGEPAIVQALLARGFRMELSRLRFLAGTDPGPIHARLLG